MHILLEMVFAQLSAIMGLDYDLHSFHRRFDLMKFESVNLQVHELIFDGSVGCVFTGGTLGLHLVLAIHGPGLPEIQLYRLKSKK